jgi:hypothetical protein
MKWNGKYMICNVKERTQAEGVWELGNEDNIWNKVRGSNARVKDVLQRGA